MKNPRSCIPREVVKDECRIRELKKGILSSSVTEFITRLLILLFCIKITSLHLAPVGLVELCRTLVYEVYGAKAVFILVEKVFLYLLYLGVFLLVRFFNRVFLSLSLMQLSVVAIRLLFGLLCNNLIDLLERPLELVLLRWGCCLGSFRLCLLEFRNGLLGFLDRRLRLRWRILQLNS